MIDLSRHIEFLLLNRNEVCVQQLGTFRAISKESRWEQDEHIFLPPYRTIEFHEDTTPNDDTFLSTLVSKYKVSRQEADILHAEFIERIHQELEDNGTADLGSIGVFIRENADSEMLFIPSEAGIATPNLYGLDAYHIAPLPMKIVVEQQEAARKEEAVIRTDNDYFVIRIHKKVVHYAAAAAACAVLFFAVGRPMINSTSDQPTVASSSTLIPGNVLAETPEAPETPAILETPEVTEVIETPIVTETPVEQPTPTPVAPAEETTTTANGGILDGPRHGYAMVLASAIPVENAIRFAEKIRAQGVNAEARNYDGMIRVVVLGFESSEAVHARIEELKPLGKDFEKAWTLRME